MKLILKLTFVLWSFISFSQSKKNDTIIDTDKLSEKQLAKIDQLVSKRGWVLLKTKEGNMITNFSNKDYRLSWGNCKTPNIYIEYTKNYRDGTFGGIDFDASDKNKYAKVEYFLDAKNYNNPFKLFNKTKFKPFFDNLKTAKVFTINYYDKELNPETGKNEMKLNRSIDFKLANGSFLDEPTNCN
jgi:hypothetical protein